MEHFGLDSPPAAFLSCCLLIQQLPPTHTFLLLHLSAQLSNFSHHRPLTNILHYEALLLAAYFATMLTLSLWRMHEEGCVCVCLPACDRAVLSNADQYHHKVTLNSIMKKANIPWSVASPGGGHDLTRPDPKADKWWNRKDMDTFVTLLLDTLLCLEMGLLGMNVSATPCIINGRGASQQKHNVFCATICVYFSSARVLIHACFCDPQSSGPSKCLQRNWLRSQKRCWNNFCLMQLLTSTKVLD